MLDADIRDYAYQLFVAEVPELLQCLEQGVLNLQTSRDPVSIHSLMRAAHSLKGNAASLGLDAVKEQSHRLESAIKALYDESLVVSTALESSFLAVLDCLRATLNAGLATGNYLAPSDTEAYLSQLEAQLAHITVPDTVLLSSQELGVDITRSLFEVDIERALVELETVPAAQLEALLRQQAETFADLGMMLDLPALTAQSQAVLAAEQPLSDIAPAAIQAWRAIQTAVLAGTALPEVVQWSAKVSTLETPFPAPVLGEATDDLFALLSDSVAGLAEPVASPTPTDVTTSLPNTIPSTPIANASVPDAIAANTMVARTTSANAPTANRTLRIDRDRLEYISSQAGELSIGRNQLQNQQELIQQTLVRLQRRLEQLHHTSTKLAQLGDQLLTQPLAPATASASSRWGFDSLELDRYSDLHLAIQDILEEKAQLEEALEDLQLVARQNERTLRDHARTIQALNTDLTQVRLLPLSQVFERLPRIVRDLAVQQGKQITLNMTGEMILVDRSVIDQLYDPLLHLIRNAIDHGIEVPTKRQGKAPTAQIQLMAAQQGGQVVIQISDDGRGLNTSAIKARAAGFMSTAALAKLSVAETYALIFQPGFSTAAQVSEISGRGVGLDVVKTQLTALKGSVSVSSRPGLGTDFSLRLPASLGMARLTLCSAQWRTYAFPLDTIAEIRQTRAASLLWQGQTLAVHPLVSLLHYGRAAAGLASRGVGEPQTVLICVRDDQAIAIDQLIAQEELVIKPLSPEFPAPNYLYGCTVSATGQLIPVLDGWLLGQQAQPLVTDPAAINPFAVALSPVAKSHILVVDDSVMMRQTLARQLERGGYAVSQAKDGQDAIATLETTAVDLVLCDVEMPRLNGFEFLTYRRQHPNLSTIPTVMLTSRSGTKHRRLAEQLGADGYLTKPCLEAELLTTLQGLLA